MYFKGGAQALDRLRHYCRAGILLHDRGAIWFDSLEDAIKARADYVQPASESTGTEASAPVAKAASGKNEVQEALSAFELFRRAVEDGGVEVPKRKIQKLLEVAEFAGLGLATREEAEDSGVEIAETAAPLFIVTAKNGEVTEYFVVSGQDD